MKKVQISAGMRALAGQIKKVDKGVGEYVIVHELLHFSVPNHGRLWKSLMRAHLGDYEKHEEKLRKSVHGTSLRLLWQLAHEISKRKAAFRAAFPVWSVNILSLYN